MMTDFHFQQLIDGNWVDAYAGGVWELVNPATEEVIQTVPFGDSADIEAAIIAAQRAFPAWARRTPYERAAILAQAADWISARVGDLARLTTEESGKPYAEALAEWRSAPNYLLWAAEEAKRIYGRTIPARVGSRRIQVTYQPLGVIGVITAWNFPVYNVVRAWSSALAVGCTVVGRPSEYTPRSAMLIAQALHESGAPPGVINLVNGDPVAMGQALLNAPAVRKIHFTGSTRVGKLLLEGSARTVTRLSLELGGNAPVLVFPDVKDVAAVAEQAVAWKFRNCGQVCVAPQRFYVHDRVVEEFTQAVVAATRRQVVGNGLERGVTVGPLINHRQRERLERLVADAVAQGAQLLTGGRRPPRLTQGYFYEPTVLQNLPAEASVLTEEVFGPVLPIIPFGTVEEALALANATEYGLTAFVQTQDLNTALRMSEELAYGMVCVNDWLPATPEAPFGGVKQSGLGRESGSEGLHEYLEAKTTFFGNIN